MSTPALTPKPPIALLSVAANLERHALASGEPWVLLLDVIWPGSSNPTAQQQHVRLARNLDPITFDAGDGNGPQLYQPFNFSVGDFKASSKGAIPDLDVTVSNVMRLLQNSLEQFSGMVGGDLWIYVVNTANPAGEPDLALQFSVMATTADAKLVHFRLGASSPMRRLFPVHMYFPNHCIWRYKSAQCGYTGQMSSCSLTLDGPIGCEAHANQMRFGGFPGIDTNGAQVAQVV